MKAYRLTGIHRMEMMEVADPVISGDNDVLISMERVGVCGSDIHYYLTGRIGSQIVKHPFTVGHEGSGTVIKVGASVKKVKPGDKIAIDPAIPCGKCDQCLIGRTHTCRHMKFLGCPGQSEGCLSELLVMPENSCFPLYDGMTLDQGALTEPLSIGYYGVKLSNLYKGAKIGILGAGPIGESVLVSAINMGAEKIYMTDKLDYRLEFAIHNGATWTGNPNKDDILLRIKQLEPLQLDMVFECCGKQEAVNLAVDLLKPGGKLMIIGIPEFDRWSFNVDKLRHKEICIQNVRRQNDCVSSVIDLINQKKVHIDNWITHKFSFNDTKKAFDTVVNYKDGVLKAIIEI